MASCRNCGRKVGCGCQLTDGLCAGCLATLKQSAQNFKKYVNTQINRLRSVFNDTSTAC